MISQYDDRQQITQLNNSIIGGKTKLQDGSKYQFGIKEIMKMNKKIAEQKKYIQLKVIRARKLKIKISQVLNFRKHHQSHSSKLKQSQSKIENTQNSSRRTQSIQRESSLTKSIFQLQLQTNKNFAKSKSSQKTIAKFKNSYHEERLHLQMMQGGQINLFEHFSEEQLNMIEEDEVYYLVKSQYIQLFHKYMQKKRLNCKDYSYQKFTLKTPKRVIQAVEEPKQTSQQLAYIRSSLNIGQCKTQNNSIHLLTNPLDSPGRGSLSKQFRSHSLKNSNKKLFSDFKIRQAQNLTKIMKNHKQQKQNLKFKIYDQLGYAAENRAVLFDDKMKHITQRNKVKSKNSIIYRQRLKTVKQNYGQVTHIAESIRNDLLRRRQIKRKIPEN